MLIEEKHIIKYLEGQASVNLRKEIDLWISLSQDNRDEFEFSKMIWEESSGAADYVKFDTDLEWNDFMNLTSETSNITQVEEETKIQEILEEVEEVQELEEAKVINFSAKRDWKNILSIAASFIVLIAATWIFWPQSEYIDIVDAEVDTELILDDGSIVSISEGASFRTLRSYKYAKERNAKINGEVNFDIASDPEKPFIVETDDTAVRVLGTIFNVKTAGKESEVANEEGRVKFYVKEDESQFVNLNKGDRIKFDGTGFIDLNEPEPEPEPEPIPIVKEIVDYLKVISKGRVTFGSGLEEDKISQLDIDYKDKSVFEVIRLMEEKAIVIYTTSCYGCFQINEIIPFK